jgi:hypothetical protein
MKIDVDNTQMGIQVQLTCRRVHIDNIIIFPFVHIIQNCFLCIQNKLKKMFLPVHIKKNMFPSVHIDKVKEISIDTENHASFFNWLII